MLNDTVRAALIALFQSLLPIIQIAGIYEFTSDEIATIMLFVTNAVTLIFLAFKSGQQDSGTSNTISVTSTPADTVDPPITRNHP